MEGFIANEVHVSHTFNTIKKARVRTVLFDLGNVLVRLQPEMMAKTLEAVDNSVDGYNISFTIVTR